MAPLELETLLMSAARPRQAGTGSPPSSLDVGPVKTLPSALAWVGRTRAQPWAACTSWGCLALNWVGPSYTQAPNVAGWGGEGRGVQSLPAGA